MILPPLIKKIKKALCCKRVSSNNLSDFSESEIELCKEVSSMTMTSPERIKALSDSVNYLISNDIEGDFVECGVWKGGSIYIMIKTLLHQNITNRNIYLFDTFEGMSEPTYLDKDNKGYSAKSRMENTKDDKAWIFAKSSIDEVKDNLSTLAYPTQRFHFITGKVEDTLHTNKPEQIALLRLDTDWYESTKVEINELFDNVVTGGIIIIDDYGHWQGCKKAIDEFIEERNDRIFLSRIDYTGRLIIKQQP